MAIHNPEYYDLAQLETATLMKELDILHYVLYERMTTDLEKEKRIFDAIHSELKKRGHNIAWSGFSG